MYKRNCTKSRKKLGRAYFACLLLQGSPAAGAQVPSPARTNKKRPVRSGTGRQVYSGKNQPW